MIQDTKKTVRSTLRTALYITGRDAQYSPEALFTSQPVRGAAKRISLELDRYSAPKRKPRGNASIAVPRRDVSGGDTQLSLSHGPTLGVSASVGITDGSRHELHIAQSSSGTRHVVVNKEAIAEGSQGLIYAAVNTTTGEPLVLKKFKSRNIESALTDALQEANVATDVSSRVAPVAVVKEPDGIGILSPAMSANMTDCIALRGNWSVNKRRINALRGLHQLLQSVQCGHKSGYIHCDIKSDNVFYDYTHLWVLGDWGHAIYEHDHQASQQMRGTSAFWAPELYSSDGAPWGFTRATDIWNVGLLYLEMIAGTPVITSDMFSGFTLGARWSNFLDYERYDLDTSAFMQENKDFARTWRMLGQQERNLVAYILDPNPATRPSAGKILKRLEQQPYAAYTNNLENARNDWYSTGNFGTLHNEKLRAVLSPRELARSESFAPPTPPRSPPRHSRSSSQCSVATTISVVEE